MLHHLSLTLSPCTHVLPSFLQLVDASERRTFQRVHVTTLSTLTALNTLATLASCHPCHLHYSCHPRQPPHPCQPLDPFHSATLSTTATLRILATFPTLVIPATFAKRLPWPTSFPGPFPWLRPGNELVLWPPSLSLPPWSLCLPSSLRIPLPLHHPDHP